MPQPPVPTAACLAGRHRPRRLAAGADRPQRTTCLDCGCALVRTAATRRWYYSGALGTA